MNLNRLDDDSDQSDFADVVGGEDIDVNLNHYRVPYGYGTSKPPQTRASREQMKCCNEGTIMTLAELAAQKVACHLPFGLVENYRPPVPEPMQCRIAFWSFPQDEEDVKLYTCLANGNADYFYRAEQLINQNAVRDILQVGFHLSANVLLMSENESLEFFRVAITFDRRRITTCSCSCMTSTFWCQHVVAVCLQRIRNPQEVPIRAPVSESLQRLEKNQLQKFAQYLINELPQQILPAAQKLLDELLSGDEASINLNPGAPDPTAGATIHEQTNWCLDYTHLSLDIHRMLLKQCTTQPTVCSDIQSLHVTAPPATNEYQQLLRPIRGREPEGIWNLISIVGEMMKRRDPNLFSLLEIMTEEVLKFDRIVTWWFETKVSMHSGSSIHFTQTKNSQSTSQYSCSNFCDEIVHLWRLAALNPNSTQAERHDLSARFFSWHLAILKKHSSISDGSPLDGVGNSLQTSKRNLLELFPGFKSAMEGCHVDWSDWDEKNAHLMSTNGLEASQERAGKTGKRRKRRSKARQKANRTENSAPVTDQVADEETNSPHEDPENEGVVNEELHQLDENCPQQERRPERSGSVTPRRRPMGELNGFDNLEDDLQVYYMDKQQDNPPRLNETDNLEELIKVNGRRLADPIETLYAKTEGLHAHGHLEEARKVAHQLATEILAQRNYPSSRQLFILPRRRKKKGSLDNQMSIVASETLTKILFLCNVLIDDQENHNLIFRLVMFGVELKRAPAATRPLEVKLISQKQELIALLKNITLLDDEYEYIHQKAESIRDSANADLTDPLTTLILGNYIFESLVLSRNLKQPDNANLGFQCALSALGAKIGISEADHPLLCEGIRRQRGELALSLIIHHKDEQDKLDAILKQLLDKDLIKAKPIPERSPTSTTLSPAAAAALNTDNTTATANGNGHINAAAGNNTSGNTTNIKKIAAQQDLNQPSEAAAHFMFELAKTVFDEAGGSSNTAHLFRPQLVAQNGARSIHRKLHMCTLRIALYALGLHNRTQTNWMQRTYNGRASFIHEQALELGLPGIKFLCENWDGFLTPVEAASIADKAGCSSDADTRRIAAEMAKSCLRYVNHLDYNAVSRILAQCKEQTVEMFEEACDKIEQIAKDDSVCANVLFATARAWYKLYSELITNERHCANDNSYQLTSTDHQDTGPKDWITIHGQPHIERHHQVVDLNNPPMWGVHYRPEFMLTPDMHNYKNFDYVRRAFSVGIKALDSIKPSLHVGSKHNPKILDEILWLLGISNLLGYEYLFKFRCSVVENITDPYTLQLIIVEIIKLSSKLPEADRVNIYGPIYDKCIDSCLKQTKDLLKHTSYDLKGSIETILDVMQALTAATKSMVTAQHYWEILKFLEHKMKIEKRSHRRSKLYINLADRRQWLSTFGFKSNDYLVPQHWSCCEQCCGTRQSNHAIS